MHMRYAIRREDLRRDGALRAWGVVVSFAPHFEHARAPHLFFVSDGPAWRTMRCQRGRASHRGARRVLALSRMGPPPFTGRSSLSSARHISPTPTAGANGGARHAFSFTASFPCRAVGRMRGEGRRWHASEEEEAHEIELQCGERDALGGYTHTQTEIQTQNHSRTETHLRIGRGPRTSAGAHRRSPGRIAFARNLSEDWRGESAVRRAGELERRADASVPAPGGRGEGGGERRSRPQEGMQNTYRLH